VDATSPNLTFPEHANRLKLSLSSVSISQTEMPNNKTIALRYNATRVQQNCLKAHKLKLIGLQTINRQT
jgi:hypothetical protein